MLDVDLIKSMARGHVRDYVIPGLTSSLVGGEGKGMVRLFTQERHHEEPITPHSHRFDFQCLVLEGKVTNRIWYEASGPNADPYQMTTLEHHGSFGDQTRKGATEQAFWQCTSRDYKKGEIYSMRAEEIHSIFFGKGAVVLFFEGPNKSDTSCVLEPVSNGRVIPTFKVEPWMFKKD